MKAAKTFGVLWVVFVILVFTVSALAEGVPINEDQALNTFIQKSANSCPNWVGTRDEAILRGIAPETLTVLIQRSVLVCPAINTPEDVPIIWYGTHKAMVWNPNARNAADGMYKILSGMAQQDSFPANVQSFTAAGDEEKGRIVPDFTTR